MAEEVAEIILPASTWILFFDASCSINSPAFWSTNDAVDRIWRLKIAHELVLLQVVLEGYFKVRCILRSSAPAFEMVNADVSELVSIVLPSGRLVACTTDEPTLNRHVLTVPPGRYRVLREWSVHEESKHYDVESAEAYPADEGPDGIITLWPER
ncbi:hypothetical protein [Chondromyces crocatus]|uniref:Uncharacterized protein n=2 Tax=Chondromyces crocatus TaxID=52 RepID=A0A0K1EC30_CHOCO|nr:hypothetical protein [Chondromyces crocatus]AKT38414.1 uncharacterized protein CMC5_025600 [Chondromyces crocatus]